MIPGFLQPGDALVPCVVCEADSGKPCRTIPSEEPLEPGVVHFCRRMARMLLSAKLPAAERSEFERVELEKLSLRLRRLPRQRPKVRQ